MLKKENERQNALIEQQSALNERQNAMIAQLIQTVGNRPKDVEVDFVVKGKRLNSYDTFKDVVWRNQFTFTLHQLLVIILFVIFLWTIETKSTKE